MSRETCTTICTGRAKRPRTYVVTERYRDEAAFQAHQTSAYGPPLFKQMRATIAIEVEYFDSVE
jgi:quinol monooxygenase YgiN